MVILGLGSNEGDRLKHLGAAVAELKAFLKNVRLSRIYESKAVLPPGAPPEWDKPFLNMALAADTALSPAEIFIRTREIERKLGRTSYGHWSPRTIDIDLLAIDDMAFATADLIIPHRELLNRDFALLPLAEVAPDWQYPETGPFGGWKAADIVARKEFRPNPNLRDTEMTL